MQTKIPSNLEAEKAFLGSVIVDPREFDEGIAAFLAPEDFFDPRHRKIYSALLHLAEKDQPIDVIGLSDRLKELGHLERIGGTPYLAHIAAVAPLSGQRNHLARIIHEKSFLRRMRGATMDVLDDIEAEKPQGEIMEKLEREVLEIGFQSNSTQDLIHMPVAMKTTADEIERLFNRKADLTGVSTSLQALDRFTSGLQPGELTLIAARPSMGKTALAIAMAIGAAHAGHVVEFHSLEMPATQLVQRIFSMKLQLNLHRIRTGKINDKDWSRLVELRAKLQNYQLYIDETPGISIAELRAKARRAKRKYNLGILFVDYLQLMRGNAKEGREREVSDISRGLKELAMELKIPVVVLSQLNRGLETRKEKRPMLSDLRESGSLEQDADNVIFVYREVVYDEEADPMVAELIIGKQRNGPIGTVEVQFLPDFTAFIDKKINLDTSFPDDWLTVHEKSQDSNKPPVRAMATSNGNGKARL